MTQDPREAHRLAEAVARQAHAEQIDKSGAPYIGHLERVAAAVSPDPDAMAVAWLHDLVEDQPHCAGYLMDFPAHIVRSVYLLTKLKGEQASIYYARIKADPRALKVKLADIADNMSEHRMGRLDSATQKHLRAKYAKAIAALTPAPAEDVARLDPWQPIETAPKDGETTMLLWDAENEVMEMGFRPADCPDDAAVDLMGTACYPTHWRPLPEPPVLPHAEQEPSHV